MSTPQELLDTLLFMKNDIEQDLRNASRLRINEEAALAAYNNPRGRRDSGYDNVAEYLEYISGLDQIISSFNESLERVNRSILAIRNSKNPLFMGLIGGRSCLKSVCKTSKKSARKTSAKKSTRKTKKSARETAKKSARKTAKKSARKTAKKSARKTSAKKTRK